MELELSSGAITGSPGGGLAPLNERRIQNEIEGGSTLQQLTHFRSAKCTKIHRYSPLVKCSRLSENPKPRDFCESLWCYALCSVHHFVSGGQLLCCVLAVPMLRTA